MRKFLIAILFVILSFSIVSAQSDTACAFGSKYFGNYQNQIYAVCPQELGKNPVFIEIPADKRVTIIRLANGKYGVFITDTGLNMNNLQYQWREYNTIPGTGTVVLGSW